MTLRSDTGRPIVYLHIGAMKTGTTYLQELLYANREQLAAAGLVLPGETWARQVRGVQDVMGLGRTDRHIRRMSQGAWAALLEEARSSPDNVSLISVEFFSFAGRRKVRRIMSTLDGFDVRVILTVRDVATALPSQWQTMAHNGGRWSWHEFLEGVPSPTVWPLPYIGRLRPIAAQFHRTQNVARMLATWAPHLTPGALHVVTVPRRRDRPDELWQRVAQVVGVDAAAVTQPPERTNPSLGHASSELVRRLNTRLKRLPTSEYNWTVKEIALEVLSKRAGDEDKARLTRPAYDLALRWNALTHRTVEEVGARVTGDLADLPTTADDAVRSALPEVASAPRTPMILDAAEDAAAGFSRQARRRRRRLARAGIEVELADRPSQQALRALWEATEDPVDAAATELADRAYEDAMLLRRIREERHRNAEV